MRKKGYTLIEVITVIAIMIILIGSGFSIVSSLKYIKNDVEAENSIYEIYNILSYSKAYCRRNYCEGKIIIDVTKNSIVFKRKSEGPIFKEVIVKNEDLPSNITISSNFRAGIINVSNVGYLNNAGTIRVYDGKKYREVSISVGNDSVNIKDDKEIIDEVNR